MVREPGERVGERVGEKVGEKVGVKNVSSLTENQQKIMECLMKDPRMSASALSVEIGISARKVENNIRVLKEKGVLTRHGSPKKGYWSVQAIAEAAD